MNDHMNDHRIRIWYDVDAWCAAHTYAGEHDTSDPLPPEAQDDPVGYCQRRWPLAAISVDDNA